VHLSMLFVFDIENLDRFSNDSQNLSRLFHCSVIKVPVVVPQQL